MSKTQPDPLNYQGTNRLTLGIVLGVLTFWLFAQSMVNIVPSIQDDINIPLGTLNFAISLTALFSGCFIVLAGGLADKFGRVKITNIGFILSIIGSLFIIFSKEEILFSLGRVIQGLSAACIMPATLALMNTDYKGKARQKALSFWSIGSWGGAGLCSLVGGCIATYAGWRWIFILSILFAVAGMLLIRGTPESKSQEKATHGFDYLGFLTFIIALICLNILITRIYSLGWENPLILGLFVLFLLAALVFLWAEIRKKKASFIDFSLFKNKYYSCATFSNFILNAAGGTLMVSSMYVQQGRGFTSFQAGILTIGYLISVLLMIRVGEKLLQIIGAKKPMLWGSLLAAVGIGIMALTSMPNTAYVIVVFIGYILLGTGLGIYATPSTDTALSNVPADMAGIASGIYKMASSLGAAFGLAISGAVFNALIPSGVAIAATGALFANAVFCLLSLVTIMFMLSDQREKHVLV